MVIDISDCEPVLYFYILFTGLLTSLILFIICTFQVIAEGLPLAISKFLQATCQKLGDDFRGEEKRDDGDNDPVSALPYVSGINLANSLHELSSRSQNRQFMLNSGVPYSLCCLLVDAASRGRRRRERDRMLQFSTEIDAERK